MKIKILCTLGPASRQAARAQSTRRAGRHLTEGGAFYLPEAVRLTAWGRGPEQLQEEMGRPWAAPFLFGDDTPGPAGKSAVSLKRATRHGAGPGAINYRHFRSHVEADVD
jgi:hypothetical protein